MANEPFLFYTGEGDKHFTGTVAWSLKGLAEALRRASLKSVEFHNARGDFEKWAEASLGDKTLAEKLKKVRLSKLSGKPLAEATAKVVKQRFDELSAQTRAATKYF
jgi:hypothetical protein